MSSLQPSFLAPPPKRLASLNEFLYGVVLQKLSQEFPAQAPYVQISGYLGGFEDRPLYRNKYFGISLTEGTGEHVQSINIDVARSVLESRSVRAGQYVAVRGRLSVRKKKKRTSFEFRIDVDDISVTNSPTEVRSAIADEQRVTFETLKIFGTRRNPFPVAPALTISVLHSKSRESDAFEDFSRQLRGIADFIELRPVPTDMTSAKAIAVAISKADGNVLVIVRGGGEQFEFAEFEKFPVLEALSKKDAYRVLGIGHSRTSTLLDFVCECSEATPSAAGTHIRDVGTRLFNDARAIRRLNEERDLLMGDLQSARREQVAIGERLQQQSRVSEQNFKAKQVRTYQIAAFVAGLCLILGFLIALKVFR